MYKCFRAKKKKFQIFMITFFENKNSMYIYSFVYFQKKYWEIHTIIFLEVQTRQNFLLKISYNNNYWRNPFGLNRIHG